MVDRGLNQSAGGVGRESLDRTRPRVREFAALLDALSSAEDCWVASLAAKATSLTRQHFGKAIRLFAPLYLSNECINNCSYCGFSRDNEILRVTLTPDQVDAEADYLLAQGFRNLLLVAGEHPRFVSNGYLEEVLKRLSRKVPSLAIEVAPMEEPEYARMVGAGAEGVVVYQETYDPAIYAELHTAGPKRDYGWRLACPDRAYRAGVRRIGVGALLGLRSWREEAVDLAAHLDGLLRRCWKAQFTVSLPRLRPCAGGYRAREPVTDRSLLILIIAFRLVFPQVGLVLSTREPQTLRDLLLPLGVTLASAGSHTEPGGYTGQAKQDLHLTVRGRRVDVALNEKDEATGQFDISDDRSPAEMAQVLADLGLEAVWKDWDGAILTDRGDAASTEVVRV
jgi:2-iminoacetate synthase